MADTVGFFQILNPTECEWLSGFAAKTSDELYNGMLCKFNNDHTVSVAGAGDTPAGFAYILRTQVYAPTTVKAQAGEYVAVVRGHVRFLADASFFSADALPAFGANLYTAANGEIAATGTTGHLGKCLVPTGILDYRTPPNTTTAVAECEAHFADA